MKPNRIAPERRPHRSLGFTLVETLIVIAIISVMASAAYLVSTNVQKNTTATKLMQDVASVNRALAVYQASGGSLEGLSDAQAILDRLKTRMEREDAVQMAGMRGSLVDPRLAVALQTSQEGQGSEQRAFWNATNKSFYISTTGGAGIREFVMDEALAAVDYGTAARNSAFKLAKDDPWVWDFANKEAPSRGGPSGIPSTTPGTNPTKPSAPPGALRLNPPTYSVVTGTYSLDKYPMSLTLAHTNPPGVANILYSLNSGDWRIYTDPMTLKPGDKVDAMVGSLDPDHWIDSTKKSETYQTAPVAPEFELKFGKEAYSYADLGGAMMPGGSNQTPPPVYGELKLTNGSSIPSVYQSSEYFTAKWTKDGSSPLTNTAAQVGEPFSNGFVPQRIPLTLADYGAATSVVVKAAGNSLDTNILKNSSVIQQNLGISKQTLRTPVVTVNERTATMTLTTTSGDMPVGAQIYYTTDGTDPGNNNGQPTGGKLYAGAFELTGTAGTELKITARVYPPASFTNWFEPSTSAVSTIKLPGAIDFYVGGNFYLPTGSGSAMRNIAKLKGEGSVDPSFDVGKGTTENSLVGVIRQEAAGKVLAGGDFESVNNVPRPAVVRLNPNGSVDTGFDAGLAGGK